MLSDACQGFTKDAPRCKTTGGTDEGLRRKFGFEDVGINAV